MNSFRFKISHGLINLNDIVGRRWRVMIAVMVIALSSLLPFGIYGRDVQVKAKLDSATLLMGRIGILHVEVVEDEGTKGHFPILADRNGTGLVGICGDSIELRTAVRRDTTSLGSGRIQINYQIPIQSFDSGAYRIPELLYVAGKDTAATQRLSLKVLPIPVGENEAISDYTSVEDPADKSIFDKVPDWIIDYWFVWLLIIIIAVLAYILYKRYRKEGTILKKKPEPTPYERASAALRNLKERKLWEQGMEKEYFTRLTDILRVYLDGRFGINAMEMTTRDIINRLSETTDLKDKREYVRRILDMADFVKFAKVRPLPADNIKAYDDAVKFVEETKPQETTETDTSVGEEKKGKGL